MTPIRTCVGCGTRASQAGLMRIVAGPSGLRVDQARRAGGRGGYLHEAQECWQAFVRRRGAVRSLRMTPSSAERAELVTSLQRMTEEV